MHNAYRTPSPEKTDPQGNRKHSPWTAQRARKKNRSSPDVRLPGVSESLPEDVPIEGEGRQINDATGLAVHLAQNPFLGAQAVNAGVGNQSLLAFRIDRPFAFHTAQEVMPDRHSLPCDRAEWPFSTSAPAEQQIIFPSAPSPVEDALSLEWILHSTACTASSSQCIDNVELSASEKTGALLESKRPLNCLTMSSQKLLPLVNNSLQLQAVPKTNEAANPEPNISTTPKPSLTCTSDAKGLPYPGTGLNSLGLRHARVEPFAERMPETSQKSARMLEDSPAHVRAPLQDVTPDQSTANCSVAATPSPGVPAPGLRLDHQGCVPPRVSTCRTIRRVLVSSPQSSQSRPWSAECRSAPMSVDNGHLLTNQELGRPQPIQEATAMQITEHAECESYQYGSNLTWMTATPETAEESEADFMDNASHSNLEEESPDFILAKGHITPNNLLPGWDDEDEGPWGPRKGYYTQPIRRRSGQLATFDERLQEAIENGDAVTLGQAWRDVRSGNVKPDDIDTLNALLKCYCKVEGDPVEAEEIVKEVCRDGRLLPNASTYHHMASLWTRHDQLNNSE